MQQFLSRATACELTRTRNCYAIQEYKVYLPQSTVVSKKHRSLLYENIGLSYYENMNSVKSPAIKLEVNMGTFYYSFSNVTAVDNNFAHNTNIWDIVINVVPFSSVY